MLSKKSINHVLLGVIILGLVAWIFINKEGLEGFNAYYYLPRRDPDEYVRYPLKV